MNDYWGSNQSQYKHKIRPTKQLGVIWTPRSKSVLQRKEKIHSTSLEQNSFYSSIVLIYFYFEWQWFGSGLLSCDSYLFFHFTRWWWFLRGIPVFKIVWQWFGFNFYYLYLKKKVGDNGWVLGCYRVMEEAMMPSPMSHQSTHRSTPPLLISNNTF